MYLARIAEKGKTRYIIRQSYKVGDGFMSKDLLDLGNDPSRYIVYSGSSGYYYSAEVEEALAAAGAPMDQAQLDQIFYEFLKPNIRRIIDGFDRGRRRTASKAIDAAGTSPDLWGFDKRRFHYLRFGMSDQRHIDRVPEKLFRALHAKSRDELEQYFLSAEGLLRSHEKPVYVSLIFELKRFTPEAESGRTLRDQMDAYFISRICLINADSRFREGAPADASLHPYLVKYAEIYFDFETPRQSPWQAYVEDFINRHRIYHQPAKVTVKLEEAGRLFGLPWKELKKLDRGSLSRLYRQLALKHHPDKGGDTDIFRRLTQYYHMLLKRKE
ncbi:MAG: hypothetical protein HZB87_00970 [Desulfatitalea sp.]|nr:hypothetical protein [Desulfatitalea sp.]